MDLKDTKELVKFVIGLGEAVDKSLADGRISIGDLRHFMNPLMDAGDAFSDISNIPAELKDMTQEESQELLEYIRKEFDIENDKIEKVIENSLQILVKLYEVIELVRSKNG